MKKYIILLAIISVYKYGNAQTDLRDHSWRISFEPQYLFINGLKFNFEKRLNKKQYWLILSPSIFYREIEEKTYYYNKDYDNGLLSAKDIRKVKGVGLSLEKLTLLADPFFYKSTGLSLAPYINYGISWNVFEITGEDEDWIIVPQDGINYMQMGMKHSKTIINKSGINISLGIKSEIMEDIVLDIYLGCGIRYSFYEGEKKYNMSTSDYGYKGVLLLGGIKIGAGF